MSRTDSQGTERSRSAEDSLLALLDACERPLYGYLVHMLRDLELAQDCAQEIGGMLGVRDAAVRQRLLRARERFRLLYGDAA